MLKTFFTIILAASASLIAYSCTMHVYEWEPKHMNPERGNILETELKPDSFLCGFVGRCQFDMHYFFGPNADLQDANRKNVLYIPGGPGEIVNPKRGPLDDMALGVNYIYFHVRGTGYSEIPGSNSYDQFLQAKYVVEDIEALRQHILTGAWDAIYAHSWGTIVAQMYASTYPQNVKKLILSAPVSRTHGSTESERRKMIISNLMTVYHTYRRQPKKQDAKSNAQTERNAPNKSEACSWSGSRLLVDLPKGPTYFPETDTFCFLDEGDTQVIRESLTTLLNDLAFAYGSISFVNAFYNDLLKEKPFTDRRLPHEFFLALRDLELYGAGEREGMQFEPEVKKRRLNAAFFLGYYLMLQNKPQLDQLRTEGFNCDPDAEFLSGLELPDLDANNRLQRNFCKRIEAAERDLRESTVGSGSSSRARAVFGIYDGLARWVFEIIGNQRRLDQNGCFTGREIQDIASGTLLKDKVAMQLQAKKLGLSLFDTICPWDPKPYCHDVETLILAGDADPVIAGGQANYFYQNGLAPGKRVLFRFPGVGHSMRLQVKRPSEDPANQKESNALETPEQNPIGRLILNQFGGLLALFLDQTIGEVVQNPAVLDAKTALDADMLPSAPEITSGCPVKTT